MERQVIFFAMLDIVIHGIFKIFLKFRKRLPLVRDKSLFV